MHNDEPNARAVIDGVDTQKDLRVAGIVDHRDRVPGHVLIRKHAAMLPTDAH